MTRGTQKARFAVVLATCSTLFSGMVFNPEEAGADPLGAGKGAMYRLNPATMFREGCIAPCMCPVRSLAGVRGTFELAYAGFDGLTHGYTVSNVNWTVPYSDGPARILGAGRYQIGSPDPAGVLQQRMVLELRVRGEPVQRFDSGWVPLEQMPHIGINVAALRDSCWATEITLDASRVPDDQIRLYRLVKGSTYQHGCFDPCDCLLGPELAMLGTFSLVLLERNESFSEFAVVNVDWRVPLDNTVAETIPITGSGLYHRRAEFAVQHRLSLELRVGDEPQTHFDSSLVVGGAEFPRIDVIVSMNGMVCLDTVLHVMAEPVETEKCGGIAGLPCEEGRFCKLPVGACCCDFFGTCVPIPEGCPDVWEPVCGCDGQTYGNECDADAAGVSLAHFGPCGVPCGVDSDCPEPEQFCKFPVGTCGDASVGGLCTPVPGTCPRLWEPVCGCDGVTYPNECEADRAHVSVLHRGECEAVCAPTEDGTGCIDQPCSDIPESFCAATRVHLDPATNQFRVVACDCLHFNTCHLELREGRPVPVGTCPDGTPCELIGRDTDNDGMDDVFTAGCTKRCGGFTGNQCADGAFCKFPEGVCSDAADHTGVCTPIPNACPEVYDPVCGCDGVTYVNECEADAAGVSIRHRGACDVTCHPSDDGTECVPLACSPIPEDRCMATALHLDVNTGAITVRGCECRDMNECHIELGNASPFAVGNCPEGLACRVAGSDTDNDGIDDLFTAVCEPNGEGECCEDITDGPVPFESCTPTDAQACQAGIFHPVNTACTNVQACCLGSFGGTALCVDLSATCCIDSGGVPLGSGTSCANTTGCPQICGGIAGIPCADPGAFCKLPVGDCCCDQFGMCTPIPDACPENYEPVCGCDGVTYGNECEADAAAVSIRHRGECESRCAATRVFSDAALSYCAGEPVEVQILLTPPAEASAIGLEDAPPPDWQVETTSHDGVYDAVNHKVKWGPLFPPFPERVSYVAVPPDGPPGIQCFRGTISLDGVNRPICGESCLPPCCPLIAADVPQPACDACMMSSCEDCPDGNCRDGRVSLCEVTSYACAWRRGCHDDIAAMTRAAFIWRNGECYCWNEQDRDWFPTPCGDVASRCCAATGLHEYAGGGSATARLPDFRKGGASSRSARGVRTQIWAEPTVSVSLIAPDGASAAALEIQVPDGWAVAAISNGGRWDASHRKVKWGPFFEELSRTVTFQLRARDGKFGSLSRGGRSFSGTVSFDGVNLPVTFR